MKTTIIAVENVDESISKLVKVAVASQALAHEIAVSILSHLSTSGDIRHAVKLVNALPKGFRREGLAVWFEKYSSKKLVIKFNEELGQYSGKLHSGWNADDIKVEEGDATPFYDLTKEVRPGKTKGLDDLIKQLKGWANNDKTTDDGKPAVSEEARDTAAALVAFYESKRAKVALSLVA
jgi:hypothetical protein